MHMMDFLAFSKVCFLKLLLFGIGYEVDRPNLTSFVHDLLSENSFSVIIWGSSVNGS